MPTRANRVNRLNIDAAVVSIALLLASIGDSFAQQRDPNDPWWFEVEAIIFKRNIDLAQIPENFPRQLPPMQLPSESYVADYLYPDISWIQQALPTCDEKVGAVFPMQSTEPPKFSKSLLYGSFQEYEAEQETLNQSQPSQLNPQLFAELIEPLPFTDVEWVVDNTPIQSLSSEFENGSYLVESLQLPSNLPSSYRKYPVFEPITPDWHVSFTKIDTIDSLGCRSELDLELAFEHQPVWSKRGTWQQVPKVLDGVEYPYSETAYVLPRTELELNSIYRQIRRTRGLTPMLHMAWRQEVIIGRDKAPFYRIFAGENFNDRFNQDLTSLDSTRMEPKTAVDKTSVIAEFERILGLQEGTSTAAALESDDKQIGSRFPGYDLWELDGKLKVFIEYIGGVPYLHVDSMFDFRLPTYFPDLDPTLVNGDIATQTATASVPLSSSDAPAQTEVSPNSTSAVPAKANYLQPIRFDQLRRVISTEIHYFDHPAFGMVLQVRRYRRPEPPEPIPEES